MSMKGTGERGAGHAGADLQYIPPDLNTRIILRIYTTLP